jgi:tetratricopeptide (TPR) repeat protein
MATTDRNAPLSSAAHVSRWLLAIALAGAALAIGTIHTVTLCVVTVVLAGSATLAWWGAEPIKVRPPATLLLFTGVGLVAYTVFQCVPMPMSWLAVIAPHNADVWSRALVPLHEPAPRWAAITLDPIASRIEVLKGVAYLLAFVTALRIAHRREGVGFLSAAIVVTAILLAVAALLHPAFGARKVYGVYEPGFGVDAVHVAPLLNPNHLAGYLNIGFCMTLAASLSREPRVPRAIAIALTALLGATQVWVASRGGIGAMVLGATLVGAFTINERAKTQGSRALLTAVCAGATLLGGIFMVLGSSVRAKQELFDTDLGKFAVPLDVMKMLPAYGILGTGRGAFESTYPQFRQLVFDAAGYLTFTHPENLLAQWTTEWGVPVGLAGLTLLIVALRPTAAVVRSRTAAGAWAALAAVGVQNLADFSSEIPGVMLAVVVSAAVVVGGSAGLRPKWRLERWSRAPAGVARIALVATLLALVGGLTALGHRIGEERKRMYEAATIRVVPIDQMHDLARGAMSRHPAEPYFPFITALRARRMRDENPLPWLGATLERASVHAPAHILLAHTVAARSPSQARLEYRLALEQAPEIGSITLQEAPRLVGSHDDAMELVSTGKSGTAMLNALVLALAERLPATCVRLDQELSRRAPHALGPPKRAASAAVADLDAGGDGAPWCQADNRPACLDRALTLARALQVLDPATCDGYAFEARALMAAGQPAKAMDRLAHITDKVTDRVACLQTLAGLARTAEDDHRLDTTLNEIAQAGCADDKECVQNLVWVATTQEVRGNLRRAMAMYQRAYERAPDNDSLLENVARLAGAAGLNAEALRDYQELARRHPGDGRWRKAAEEQREAMLRGAVKY